jgi:transposase-like protein
MPSDLGFYPFVAVLSILLCLLLCRLWGCGKTTPSVRNPLRAKREPKPFAGLTRKPNCEACEQQIRSQPQVPSTPPPRMILTRGRRRQVDTTSHFCPHATCVYYGWVGFGNIRANGHPTRRRWRQLVCLGCRSYFLETHGTLFHGKQVDPDTLVWALAALAEGLGIRAVARVFEVDPNTVLGWLVDAAEHLEAFSRYGLQDVHVEQVQMDELFALLSAVKDGDIAEAEAVTRLSRSPYWVWVAMDPISKLILTVDVGERSLAMAQRLVHQLTQVLAPDCTPLFLTDGFRDYLIALVTHYGRWIQPERRQGKRPMPKPHWMPWPQLLYAQVVKSYRRRRLVGVKHQVVFGVRETIESMLAKQGWKINSDL